MQQLVICIFTILLCLPAMAQANLETMQKDFNQRVIAFEKFIKYTGSSLIEAAKAPAIHEYFLASDPAEKIRLKHKIDFLSLGTQAKFNVDEMCLIDKSGVEISRVVYQQIAPDKDLSAEEASAPFFNPAFDEEDGQVHLSAPYVSADSLRWVLCFATPIVLADGSKPAIYHYEISQYVVQGLLNKGLTSNSKKFLLLVNKEGYVVSDSRRKFKLEFNVTDTEMKTPFSDYFPKFKGYLTGFPSNSIKNVVKGKGKVQIDGNNYNYLYQPLGYNDWTAILFHQAS
jgi:hypothetical protein